MMAKKHPVRQDLGCFFLFLKSDANPRRRQNAFQSISYHSFSLARKLKV